MSLDSRASQPKANSPKRVAVVYHSFAHYRAGILEELHFRGRHEYTFMADDHDFETPIDPWRPPQGVRFVRCRCRRIWGSVMWQSGVMKQALRGDFDTFILLGNAHWPATWLGGLIARLRGRQVLFWTHGWIRTPKGIGEIVRRWFYRIADGLLLYGHHAKQLGIRNGFDPTRLHVVYNSLNHDLQVQCRNAVTEPVMKSIRRDLFGDEDLPTVICSARLVPAKRLDLLIEALAILRDSGVRAGLILVGDGPARTQLDALASRHHVPTAFVGALYDENRLAGLIAASDVAVSPGSIGLTAIHALVYGTPVISHDDVESQGPEWEAILPGETGDLFRKEDAADLARSIGCWLDRTDRASVRAAAHRVVDRFWNPRFQRRAIERAIDGCPADDLFWMQEPAGPDDAR